MAKPRINEEQITEARSRTRQDKRTPFLINQDDGRLYPNTALVAKNPKYRPYHGDVRASEAERMAYLAGRETSTRRKVVLDPEPFNLSRATADEIVSFAMEEYGAALDADQDINDLRAECFKLSQLPEMEVPAAPPPTGDSATGMGAAPRPRGRPRNNPEA